MDQFYYESGYIDESYFVYVAEAQGLIADYIDAGYIDVNYYQGQGAGATLVCDLTEVTGETVEASGSWSSESTVTVAVTKILSTEANISAEFTQSATAAKVVFFDSSLDAESTQVSDVNIVRGFGVGLSSDADCSCVNYRVRTDACNAGALFNVATSATATINSFAILDSVSTVSATVDRVIGEITASLESTVTFAADVRSFTDNQISISAAFAFSITENKLKGTAVSLITTSLLTTLPQVILLVRDNGYMVITNTSLESPTPRPSPKFGTNGPLFLSLWGGVVDDKRGVLYTQSGSEDIYTFGSSNWTVEFWYYTDYEIPGTSTTLDLLNIYDSSNNSDLQLSVQGDSTSSNSSNRLQLSGSLNNIATSAGAAINQWNHIAITKSGTGLRAYLNGTRFANLTTNSNFNNATRLRFSNTQSSSNSLSGFLDELLISDNARSTGTTISVPTERFNRSRNNIGLYRFEEYVLGFQNPIGSSTLSRTPSDSYLINAQSQVQAQSTVTATLSGTQKASAALTSQGFVLSLGDKLLDVESIIIVTADLDAEASRTRTVSSDIASEFTQTASGDRIRFGQSDLTSTSTQSAEAYRIITATAAISSSTTMTVTAVKDVSAVSTLTSAFTQSVDANQFTGVIADITATAAIAIQIGFALSASSDISTESSVAATVVKTTDVDSAMSSSTTQTVSGDRIRFGQTAVSSEFAYTVTGDVTRDIDSDISSEFTQSTEAYRIQQGQSEQNSAFAVSVDVNIIAGSVVDILSESALTAIIGSIKPVAIATDSIATQLTAAFKNATGTILLESQSTVVATTGFLVDLDLRNAITGIQFDGGSGIGDHFFKLNNYQTLTPESEDTFVIAFWAYDPQGTVLSTDNWTVRSGGGELTFYNDNLIFVGLGEISIFGSGKDFRTTTWTNVRKPGWAHYILYQDVSVTGNTTTTNLKLYVDGELQSTPSVSLTEDGNTPLYGAIDDIMLWQDVSDASPRFSWSVGASVIRWRDSINELTNSAPSIVTMSGSLSQFVVWWNQIPNVTELSQRQKLYNSGYVELGQDGTQSGLSQPKIYLPLNDFIDIGQKGSVNFISPNSLRWRTITGYANPSWDNLNWTITGEYTGTDNDIFDSGIRARTNLTGSLIGVTGFAAFMSASSSMSVTGLKVVGHSSDLTATSALSATISQTISGDIDLASECTQNTAISVIYDHAAALNSQFEYYLDPDFLINYGSDMSVTTELYLDFDAIPPIRATADLSASTALSAVIGTIEQFDSTLNSEFTVQAESFIKEPIRAEANLSAQFGYQIQIGGQIQANVGLSSEFAVQAQATIKEPIRIQADLTANATVNAAIGINKVYQSQMTAVAAVQAQVSKTVGISSGLTAQTTVAVSISKLVGVTANLPSIATQLILANVIQIDPFYQIKVTGETRQGTVLPENRLIMVEQETRLNMIL